jgi:hypothetical protein
LFWDSKKISIALHNTIIFDNFIVLQGDSVKKPKKSVRRRAEQSKNKTKRASFGGGEFFGRQSDPFSGEQLAENERISSFARRSERVKAEYGIDIVEYAPPQGGIKSSEALTRLVKPYMDRVYNLEDYQSLLYMGMTAWNLTLAGSQEIREKQKVEVLNRMIENHGFEAALDMMSLVSELSLRKEALFPNDDRLMVDLEVKENKTQFFCRVVALPGKSGTT